MPSAAERFAARHGEEEGCGGAGACSRAQADQPARRRVSGREADGQSCRAGQAADRRPALRLLADNKKRFPNLARMARQYLGCPASSATVERLFSMVGIAFSEKRKRSSASTLESIAFTKVNL